MGTFIIKGFTTPQFTGDWVDGGATEDLTNTPSSISWGIANLSIASGELYLDGALTPTAYADLADDFGIDDITLWPAFFYTVDAITSVDIQSPVIDASDIGIWAGGVAQFQWGISPIGLYNTQINGISAANVTLVDPYIGVGTPPVLTKWNGLLEILLNQASFEILFARTSIAAPTTLNATALKSTGAYTWEIRGTYDSYPPPPNIIYTMVGGIDVGGSATIQVLSDASGIYTLVPGQYHDELYQRTSTTTSTTVNVMIPNPFFKTGFIGSD